MGGVSRQQESSLVTYGGGGPMRKATGPTVGGEAAKKKARTFLAGIFDLPPEAPPRAPDLADSYNEQARRQLYLGRVGQTRKSTFLSGGR